MKRIISLVAAFLAGVLVVLTALLTRPNDLVEFFSGFVGTSIPQIQLALGAFAIASLILSLWVARPVRPRLRIAAFAFIAVLLAVAVASAWRETAGYSRAVVRFPASDGERVGTLYRPRSNGAGAHPAVVVLHGSGDIPRGGYHFLARRFAERGFVALIFDKRGVGDSPGRYYGDDLGDGTVIAFRTREAVAALRYVSSVGGVDTGRVGVVTISQGGWVMASLLDGSTRARFAINLSGPAVSTGEEGAWSEWTAEEKDHFGMKPPPVPFESLDRRMRDQRPSGYDPRASLATMTRPSLWLYGEWDSSVPARASIAVLDSLIERGSPVTWRMFPEANHGLFVVRGPNGRRLARFAPGVWDTVFAWTERQRITRP